MARPDLNTTDAEELARLRTENAALKEAANAPLAGGAVCLGEDDRGVMRYRIKINLPPSGGSDIKINGTSFYHGQEYDLREETVRCIQEIEYRCWEQEDLTRGRKNENFYRREQAPQIGRRA